ncbi:phosphoribosyltransferase [Nocardia sp. NPDC059195]
MQRLTWNDVEVLTKALADAVDATNIEIDHIVAVSRGGFVPARLLASKLKVRRLGSIGVRYADASRITPEIYAPAGGLRPSDKVLLVEDAIETGRSLMYAATVIAAQVSVLKTAAYYRQPTSVPSLDFVVEERSQLPQFPWE